MTNVLIVDDAEHISRSFHSVKPHMSTSKTAEITSGLEPIYKTEYMISIEAIKDTGMEITLPEKNDEPWKHRRSKNSYKSKRRK